MAKKPNKQMEKLIRSKPVRLKKEVLDKLYAIGVKEGLSDVNHICLVLCTRYDKE